MCYVCDYVLCDIWMLYDDIDRTGGSNELRDLRVPLRHIDHRVLPGYSLEWLMCCMWYFGELTKLCVYHVCVMCFRFLRIAGRHRLDCTHQRKSYEDPGLLITKTWSYVL